MWHTHFIILAFGIWALVKGSDYFVDSASRMARKLKISEFVIGLTLVAVGTSIPELVSSVIAAVREHSGLIIGNLIGSNIANIGLVVGLGAAVFPVKMDGTRLKQNGYSMLFSTFLFSAFVLKGAVSYPEALIFLIFYSAYLIILFRQNTRPAKTNETDQKPYLFFHRVLLGDFIIFLGGGCAIFLGGHFLIEEAIWFADFLGIPESIIGLSIVAVGTSLPELGVSISAARKGYGSMLIGNVIGSNIANILLVAGISALITPLRAPTSIVVYSVPIMIFLTLFLMVFIQNNWEIKKRGGISILFLYLIFIILAFLYSPACSLAPQSVFNMGK